MTRYIVTFIVSLVVIIWQVTRRKPFMPLCLLAGVMAGFALAALIR